MKKQIQPNKLFFTAFWLFLFFYTSTIICQERTAFKELLNLEEFRDLRIKKLDSLIKVFEVKNLDSLTFIYNDYANWLFDNEKRQKAISSAEKAIALAKKTYPDYIFLLQLYSSDLAYFYEKNNQYVEASNLYKEIILIDNSTHQATISYHRLGGLFYELKDYYKAYKYYEVAISLLLKSKKATDLVLLRNAYRNLINICYAIKSKKSLRNGENFGRIADSLSNTLFTSNEEIFNIKLLNGFMYNEEQNLNFDKAHRYYSQALEIAKKINDTSLILLSYQSLGDLYNIIDQEKSILYYNKAIKLTKNKDTLSSLFYGLGQTYSIKKVYNTSLHYKHKALYYSTSNDFTNIKTIKDELLINYNNKHSLIVDLQELAQTYLNYYKEKKDITFIKRAITYFKMCDLLIDELKLNSSDFKSRLYWRKLSTNIYGKAIKACFLYNDIESTFYFMEKNKALLLIEDITKNKLKKISNLTPEVLKKEKELSGELIAANLTLEDEIGLSKSKIDSLKKVRIDLEIERDILLKDVETKKLEIETSIVSLKNIQRNLEVNEVILEYHISDDDGYGIYSNNENGYVMAITKNSANLFEISNLLDLEKDITNYSSLLKNPFKTEADRVKFNKLSHHLYNRLIPPEIQQLIVKRVVKIIPDSYLSFIPFETLSMTSNAISYLINDTEIHYAYSNSFLNKIIKQKKLRNGKSLGIAPVSFKNKSLFNLKNSKQEIINMQNYYPGTVLFNKKASKDNFINNLSSSSIIHIASHANAQDNSSPWISLYDKKVTLEELYLIPNKASLVTLSACNTKIGEKATGEGIMSLARGFFYSGTRTVISSLWSIDDKSTSEILSNFYKNLSKGQLKSSALHNAKLTYLKNHNLSETSPYYWSSLILSGKNDVLLPNKKPWLLYLLITIIVGAILFVIIRKRLG